MNDGDLAPVEMESRPSRLWRYAPVVLWLALIFFASTSEFSASNTGALIQPLLRWFFPHISDQRILFIHFLVRKAGHFTEYAVLALLAARALRTSSNDTLRRFWFLAALLLVTVYALSDEYHQSFVATRTASIYDSMIDTAGGLTALCLYAPTRGRKKRVNDNPGEK